MHKNCKICSQAITPLYEVQGITYYHCSRCHFLQNFHWEESDQVETKQIEANDETRERLWPAGEKEHMRQKGWEMLELMSSPVAWFSRQLHAGLKKVPLYTTYTQKKAQEKMKKMLDFGCGHGITVLELAKEGFDITGLDPFSPTKDSRILRTELLETHFPNESFDGIFTIETMEHIPNVLDVYQELYRILKPGGVLLVQTRRLEDVDYIKDKQKWFYLREPETHVSIYSEPAMRSIAEKTNFKSVAFRGVKFARFIK